ncbi:hypothetical protein M406DRAFT_67247 [Cryphonectria parasitica EP155]|uniref:Uncharacterized protein n=1 Tax=Cryphonectria parasitica (strain ATCC 38755 / EP155) TaxID=660469 RepID=A0A9P5CVU7_CRYP1|nr:uncharacterized protein M406DRAFT_67247 [Cryphonectria parasitica EP155]KAF3770885.1 hypothetical protein M406DRAFT_67247 [Cryphonectria parasitica EP155]
MLYESTAQQQLAGTILTGPQFAPATTGSTISVFTTEYCFTAQAANSASQWPATYTVQEVCTGDQSTWTAPAPPPNFVTTIVTCNACETPTQTITCPLNTAGRRGAVSIWGNGVTATAATATATPVLNASEGAGTRTACCGG